MQSETPDRPRVRRTERFASAADAQPQAVQPQPFAAQTGLRDGTPIQRENVQPAPAAVQRHSAPMRRWLIIALIVALVAGIGLYAANTLMDAWITRQEEARAAAYQQILDRHPVLYMDLIEQYAGNYNLQPAFVAAIILNESSYDRMAESSVGARGLMQLMEDTASWIAGKVDEPGYSFARMWDPESNIKFGCWYLSYLSRMFGGDPVCVASAYHAGQGTVSRWLQNADYSPDGVTLSVDTMPEGPTRTYAGRVIRDYAIYDKIYWNAYNAPDEPAHGTDAAVGFAAPVRAGR